MNVAANQQQAEWEHFQCQKTADWAQLETAGASRNVADYFDFCVDRYASMPAVVGVNAGSSPYSYLQLQQISYRLANKFKNSCQAGQCVAFMSRNSTEFLGVLVAFARLGVTVALINTNLSGDLLKHSLNVAKPVFVLSADGFEGVVRDLNANYEVVSFNQALIDGCTDDSPITAELRSAISDRDPFVYIYTSGTTGPSKAAKFSHRRWIGCGLTWARPAGIQRGESYYIPLPMYHGNAGAVAMSTIIFAGARAVIREKFSASNFLKDARDFDCKYVIYVGEIWRYVLSQPVLVLHADSPLKVIIGNGLGSDIWSNVMSRFGVQKVIEHYGSTEMPGDAVIQWFNKVGSCGYVPPAHSYAGVIIKFDIDNAEPVRKPASDTSETWGIKCQDGESGELIMPLVDGVYDGYVDASQTEKKLYRNVFLKNDCWFSTGDNLRREADGYYYFIDRTGDTFRWKGENVSTAEVEHCIAGVAGANEVCVCGIKVPKHDGRAGLAIISVSGVDLDKLLSSISMACQKLPKYARPLFLRVLNESLEKTSTHKYLKSKYQREGISADGSCFYLINDKYEMLTQEVMEQLEHGQIKF